MKRALIAERMSMWSEDEECTSNLPSQSELYRMQKVDEGDWADTDEKDFEDEFRVNRIHRGTKE